MEEEGTVRNIQEPAPPIQKYQLSTGDTEGDGAEKVRLLSRAEAITKWVAKVLEDDPEPAFGYEGEATIRPLVHSVIREGYVPEDPWIRDLIHEANDILEEWEQRIGL